MKTYNHFTLPMPNKIDRALFLYSFLTMKQGSMYRKVCFPSTVRPSANAENSKALFSAVTFTSEAPPSFGAFCATYDASLGTVFAIGETDSGEKLSISVLSHVSEVNVRCTNTINSFEFLNALMASDSRVFSELKNPNSGSVSDSSSSISS